MVKNNLCDEVWLSRSLNTGLRRIAIISHCDTSSSVDHNVKTIYQVIASFSSNFAKESNFKSYKNKQYEVSGEMWWSV